MYESDVIALVVATGDSYNNALTETVNSMYKCEVIDFLKDQWQSVNNVELATLEWID